MIVDTYLVTRQTWCRSQAVKLPTSKSSFKIILKNDQLPTAVPKDICYVKLCLYYQ